MRKLHRKKNSPLRTILQILADTSAVHLDVNTQIGENGGISNAAQFEDLRCIQGTRADYDVVSVLTELVR